MSKGAAAALLVLKIRTSQPRRNINGSNNSVEIEVETSDPVSRETEEERRMTRCSLLVFVAHKNGVDCIGVRYPPSLDSSSCLAQVTRVPLALYNQVRCTMRWRAVGSFYSHGSGGGERHSAVKNIASLRIETLKNLILLREIKNRRVS